MKTLLLMIVTAPALSLTSCTIYGTETFRDYESGAQKAAEEISKGCYSQMDNIGIIRSGTIEMRELLENDYGIEYVEAFRSSSDYVRGYNTIMHSAAMKRFGDDYLQRANRKIASDESELLREIFNSSR